MSVYRFRLFWTIFLIAGPASGIHRSYLYPHGRGVPDKILEPQDDVSSPELFLKTPIIFYDEIYHSIFINSNGILSFVTELSPFFNIQFPLDSPLIAPLYSNVDIRASGSVYYRESRESLILERATASVKKAFNDANDFEAKSVLIVTWEDVGYHNQGVDKVNTFQVAVISSDYDSYVEFLYPENGIQWIKGTGASSGLPDALAQAGFVSSDGRMFTLKGSGTDQISHLSEWSNVGNPGQWLFRVGRVGEDGNIKSPNVQLEKEEEVPNSCTKGALYCHSKAMCDDYENGFCCVCKPGFYGNGYSCMSDDVPVRVNGKVSGVINGINLTDVVLQAYVVPTDGRSYTALSRVPMSLGYDMQSLNVLGTTIGWLFAKPVKGAVNGYHLTGGVFNQTITVTYPQTGHQIVVRQKFTGLDVFEQLTMTAEIKGSIPTIPMGSQITIKDYDEHYTRIGPGNLLVHSSQIFNLQGVQIDNAFTVEQNIQYHECEYSTIPTPPFRLKVARNFIGYETENIIRYAMFNKVTPVGVEEDPCKEGKAHCGKHSTCIAEGDSYRCVCNPGYQYIILTETESACVDADECLTGTHNCDANAACINNQGSFYCQCNLGFTGDGVTCEKEMTCDDVRCDYNAYCVIRARNMPQCFCKQGYEGNGTVCTSIDHPPGSPGYSQQGPSYGLDDRSGSGSSLMPDHKPEERPDGRPEDRSDYGRHYRPDYRPEERPDYRPDGRPDDRSDYGPYYRPDYRPEDRPDYRPDGRPEAKPEYGQYYPPDHRPDYTPDGRPDYRPDDRQDYRPDGRPDYRPDGRPDYRPDRPNYRPDGSHDYRPDGSHDYRPDSRHDYRPDSRPDYRPDNRQDYRPDGRPDYRPDDRYDYRPDGRPDYRPDDRHDYRPDSRPDYRPDDRHDYRPDGRPDYRPEGRHDYRPDGRYDYRPDYRPEPMPEEVPPRCIQNLCHCPEGYELDSNKRCFRKIEDRGGDRYPSPDETQFEGQKPVPLCIKQGKCFCPFPYKYDVDKDSCDYPANSKVRLNTKGPSGFEIPCNVLNRCHPHAQCVPLPNGAYRCECISGYQGDGIECSPSGAGYPFDADECLSPLDCVGEGDCMYDPELRRNICICYKGFYKDPISRICVEDRMDDNRRGTCEETEGCHEDAACAMRETGRPECVCKPGYEGDGKNECKKSEPSCNVVYNCADGRADCLYDSYSKIYKCKCRNGFHGDGITCTPMKTCAEDPSICGGNSSCLPSHLGAYSCQCNSGFVGNGVICKPEPERIGNFLLLNQGNTMMKVPYNPTNHDPSRPIMMQYLQQSIGIDIDCTENRVYWSDIAGQKIESASYMGTDVKKFITEGVESVEGLAIDWLSRNIYWTDSKKDVIEVASLDNSTLRKVLIKGGLVNPRGIAVHPSRGKMFWSDWNREAPKIEWSNLDGTNRAIFMEGPSVLLPNSLAVDFTSDEVCWADAGTKAIECAGIVNKFKRTITRNCSYPFGLAISRDHYYWTDWTTHKIERIARNSQFLEKPLSVPIVGSSKLYGIVAVSDTCPRISNICQHDFGRCPENHLCLPDGGGGRTCACGLDSC